MTTVQAKLTPSTDRTPAVVNVQKELSGIQWCGRYIGSKDTSGLTVDFKLKVDAFISALKAAGAAVEQNSTYRPPERAYLMHWSWQIYKGGKNANQATTLQGVDINWVHASDEETIKAAKDMVLAYGIDGLKIAPSLSKSLHTSREAIDMIISWTGTLKIQTKNGQTAEIESDPKTGMNLELHAVGESYGVIKFKGGDKDIPHWSTTGY